MQFKTFDIIPHGTKFDFVGKRHIAVVLSVVVNLAVIAWSLPLVHGLNFGVDFAGGTEMEVRFGKPVDPGAIRKGVEELGFKDASVQTYGPDSEHTYLVRVGRIALMSPEDVKRVEDAVKARFPVESTSFNADAGDKIDFQFKGATPTIGEIKATVEGAGIRVREVREEAGLTAGTKSFAVITQGIQDKIERDLTTRFAEAKPEVRRVEYVGPRASSSPSSTTPSSPSATSPSPGASSTSPRSRSSSRWSATR